MVDDEDGELADILREWEKLHSRIKPHLEPNEDGITYHEEKRHGLQGDGA